MVLRQRRRLRLAIDSDFAAGSTRRCWPPDLSEHGGRSEFFVGLPVEAGHIWAAFGNGCQCGGLGRRATAGDAPAAVGHGSDSMAVETAMTS
jgi:hypothetical protein